MFNPIFMKDVDLILGDPATGPNFKCQLRGVKLTPDTNIQKVKTLCPTGQYAQVEDPEWNLEVGYLDGDDDTLDTLGEFLLENKGDKLPFLFRPKSGGKGYSGTVTIVAGGFGGDQGNFAEQTVTLPLDGQPLPVAAVTP